MRSDGPYEKCKFHDDDGHLDDDREREKCLFQKPWFQTLVMKIAMSSCLLISQVAKWNLSRRKRARTSQVVDSELGGALLGPSGGSDKVSAVGEVTWRSIVFISIPAVTDLGQTVLAQAGLIWVSSSGYQMLRGSVIIFTCALSVKYMGKVMRTVHWVSVAIVCVAIVIVGLSGLFGESGSGGSAGEYLLGVVLIIVGQMVGAVQFVLEEWLMNECYVTPTQLVGWEGVWACLYFLVLAPVLSVTPAVTDDGELASASTIWHENFAETWDQLKNSADLQLLTAASMVALLVYNLVGNMVTKQLNAIMRSILESCRTIGVWVTSIMIFYFTEPHDSKSGEAWTNWSYLEFLGFVLLVYGTVRDPGPAPARVLGSLARLVERRPPRLAPPDRPTRVAGRLQGDRPHPLRLQARAHRRRIRLKPRAAPLLFSPSVAPSDLPPRTSPTPRHGAVFDYPHPPFADFGGGASVTLCVFVCCKVYDDVSRRRRGRGGGRARRRKWLRKAFRNTPGCWRHVWRMRSADVSVMAALLRTP